MVAWSTSEHLLDDLATDELHHVSIDLPHRHEQLDRPPVIVCLDGAWLAGTVRDATRIMSMSGEAPEAIVVGVWFSDLSMGDYLRSRARWYSPTPWAPPEESGVKGVTAEQMGQAETYRAFLRDRVLPFVNQQVPFGERWLVGHSFSALFGLHTLFHEPTLFDRYLLASPSIWWDDRAILRQEQAWAEDHDDLTAQVFLSAGQDEGGAQFDDDVFRMRANVASLVERLRSRGYPSLRLASTTLVGESHNSTTSTAINKGLRALHSDFGQG